MKEHREALKNVLTRFREVGVCLNMSKCKFAEEKVEFLDHVRLPNPEKIKVISEKYLPATESGLRSFLGLASYIGKETVPNFSSLAASLWNLLASASVAWRLLGRLKNETTFARMRILARIFKRCRRFCGQVWRMHRMPNAAELVNMAEGYSSLRVSARIYEDRAPPAERRPVEIGCMSLQPGSQRYDSASFLRFRSCGGKVQLSKFA